MSNNSLNGDSSDAAAAVPKENKSTPGIVETQPNTRGILSNRYLDEIRNKEFAKQKLIKMSAY